MSHAVTIIERAYQLARSGACANPIEIGKALQRENYSAVEAHLGAPSLRKELNALCRAARKVPPVS